MNPDIQKRLQDEIDDIMHETEDEMLSSDNTNN